MWIVRNGGGHTDNGMTLKEEVEVLLRPLPLARGTVTKHLQMNVTQKLKS